MSTAPNQTMSVAEAAAIFAQAIHDAEAWRRWEEALAKCESDPDLRRTQERIAELSGQFRAARAAGRGLAGPELAEVDRLQAEMQASELVKERDDVTSAFLTFMQRVNGVLSDQLGINFAACATPRGGGGCCG